MPENPLLPNAELKALLALTKRAKALETSQSRKSSATRQLFRSLPSREALLAGTAVQLKPGDLLIEEPGDTTATALAPLPSGSSNMGLPAVPVNISGSGSRLTLAAAIAAGLKAANTDRVVLAYSRNGASDAGWPAALTWAQERQLPLLLICADPRGDSAFRPDPRSAPKTLTWDALRRTAGKLQLPVLTVDGEDAVAIYRTVQESMLRARSGLGPVVLWAMLPSTRELAGGRPRSSDPVRRLETYFRVRKIAF